MSPKLTEVFGLNEIARNPVDELTRYWNRYLTKTTFIRGGYAGGIEFSSSEEVEVGRLVMRFGVEPVAELVQFAYEWKYGDWKRLRSDRQFPDLNVARSAFSHVKLEGLFRGVYVQENTKWAVATVGETREVRFRKRQVSSWTMDKNVAYGFASSTPNNDFIFMILKLEDPGDAVALSVPANEPGVPSWYQKMYYSLTDDKGKNDQEGEKEYILSIGHCKLKVDLHESTPPHAKRVGTQDHRPDNYIKQVSKYGREPSGNRLRALQRSRKQFSKGKVV
jgi:hypothetical protein